MKRSHANPVEPIYRRLGRRIRNARVDIGLTQAQVSRTLGIDSSNMAKIERGYQRIHIRDIGPLARALGVAPAVLLDGIW